ncbi:helix-turn-helix domain-containing protein [Actinoplanes sp. NPDC048791]|uniref:winged helix-turn-helix transcriptional regulator n=1 Tax=Actinoplanes sp. NPDC048791 TaxID=3154623 RepID=UPI0033CC4042
MTTTARSYGDGCGIAHALDLIGERWALLVVRELLLGPLRFSDLRAGLPGASPNVLSQRLRDLEHVGVIRRRRLPPPAAANVYELTEHGAELEPILVALGSWALRSPLAPSGHLSAVSAMLTLRTYYRATDDWATTLQVHLDDRSYVARIAGERVEVSAGQAAAETTVETDPGTLVALLVGERELADAGEVRVTGDVAAFRRVLAGINMAGGR